MAIFSNELVVVLGRVGNFSVPPVTLIPPLAVIKPTESILVTSS